MEINLLDEGLRIATTLAIHKAKCRKLSELNNLLKRQPLYALSKQIHQENTALL